MAINWYEKVNEWYKNGNWTKAMVWDAVSKNKITQEQYTEITGEECPEERPE